MLQQNLFLFSRKPATSIVLLQLGTRGGEQAEPTTARYQHTYIKVIRGLYQQRLFNFKCWHFARMLSLAACKEKQKKMKNVTRQCNMHLLFLSFSLFLLLLY